MPRFVPPTSGPASAETIAGHQKVGLRWIEQALAAYPELSVQDALAQVQRQGGPLDASSVGRYRADLRYGLLEHFRRAGAEVDFDAVFEVVDKALSDRKAKIPPKGKRTSAKKIKDATDEEARKLFYELKRHGLAYGNLNSILAGLFVLIAGHAGFRPVELRGAALEGSVLSLPNAKKRPGHAPKRFLDISALHEDVKKGIALMLDLIDHDLTKPEFAAWQKVIASQMRRACKRIGIRRLSLYSFRHVAIASWAAAGLSPEEIMKLCGHLSIRTAHTYYARAEKGHKREVVARPVADPHMITDNHVLEEHRVRRHNEPRTAPAFFEEDLPQLRLKKDEGPKPLTGDEVAKWRDEVLDRTDRSNPSRTKTPPKPASSELDTNAAPGLRSPRGK